MADVFTLGGVTLDLDAAEAVPVRFAERFGSIPTLTIQRRGIPLPGLPDPWIGEDDHVVSRRHAVLRGDIVSVSPHFDDSIGWVLSYQCLGLRNRLDWFPHTDSQTGVDTSVYNATPEDGVYYNLSRAGRSVGQILADVLTMPANAATAGALGIGNYALSGGVYSLPAVTANDLAALTVIPPRPVYVNGEKFGDAISGVVEQYTPNHWSWIDPNGNYRFLDKRTATVNTLTMGTDPIEPTELSRDAGDSFQRVVVRGQPIAVMALLKLSLGQITEDFAWGSYTNAQAKANWTKGQFNTPGAALDSGACTCSSDHRQSWSRRRAAQRFGQPAIGTSPINRGRSLSTPRRSPTTPRSGAPASSRARRWRRAGRARSRSTTPCPTPTSTTTRSPASRPGDRSSGRSTRSPTRPSGRGSPTNRPTRNRSSTAPAARPSRRPRSGSSSAATARRSRSHSPIVIATEQSTSSRRPIRSPIMRRLRTCGSTSRSTPIPLQAISPANDVHGNPQYGGTSHTVEGFQNTLIVTLDQWRDPGQLAQVLAYAADLLDSVKDTVVEGSVVYYGWYAAALTCGQALQVAGDDGNGPYTTGWESIANLCVVEVEVEWTQRAGYPYRTTMRVSTRRMHYQPDMFLKPAQVLDAARVVLRPVDGNGLRAGRVARRLGLGERVRARTGTGLGGRRP